MNFRRVERRVAIYQILNLIFRPGANTPIPIWCPRTATFREQVQDEALIVGPEMEPLSSASIEH
jgi:hypothetical protein